MSTSRALTWCMLALACLAAAAPAADEPPVLTTGDRIVVVRDNDLWSFGADGKDLRRLTQDAISETHPVASLDGTTLAFEAYDPLRQEYGICTLPADGGLSNRVVQVGRMPAWSPDGGRLAYVVNVRGNDELFLCNRRGTDQRRITDSQDSEGYPAWSPDGTHLAFARTTKDAKPRTAIVSRDLAGKEVELCEVLGTVTDLRWSPGTTILFSAKTTPPNSRDEINEVKPEGGRPKSLTGGFENEVFGQWAPSLLGLLAIETGRTGSRLVVRATGGQSRPVPGSKPTDTQPCIVPGPAHRVPQVFVGTRRSFYLPAPRLVGDDVLLPAKDLATQLGLTYKADADHITLSRADRGVTIALADGAVSEAVPTPPGDTTAKPATPPGATSAPVQPATPPDPKSPKGDTGAQGNAGTPVAPGVPANPPAGPTQPPATAPPTSPVVGLPKVLSPQPVLLGGVVMVPARALLALFGGQSDWDAQQRILRLSPSDKHASSGRT